MNCLAASLKLTNYHFSSLLFNPWKKQWFVVAMIFILNILQLKNDVIISTDISEVSWYWPVYPPGRFVGRALVLTSSLPSHSISPQNSDFLPVYAKEREMSGDTSLPVKPADCDNALWGVSLQTVIYSLE